MKSTLTSQQLQHFRSILLEDKNSIIQQQQTYAETSPISSQSNIDAELSMYDNHPADQATELYEQERDHAIAQGQLRQLTQIDDALNRIETGKYGRCVTCQTAIDIERLEAIPETLYCQNHANVNQVVAPQYEYEPLSFTQLNFDDEDYTGFDGEDMSQALWDYGNSNLAQNSQMLDTEFAAEINEELHGYVEPLESFIATDITGSHVHIVRNAAYQEYMKAHEGDEDLELL
ncbi:molecular chaperone DnaK [Paenibacillus endoradicis]|uniref:molecular chaperone DnaK n=1 Tax=Paenibacillus endoradicis TaxID=2972487 RepID=UPI002159B3CB|nr:molecular chaperone DnaK [Paenibacillus endoradicis]MCR8656021.1 molecular chaperone DnaK [Paenibacillus endoradicis]MCR8658347.1 molecular chaperone DnaK [Paenibacillus endoradicis]